MDSARVLTDSFESTSGAVKKLFPGARIGNCLLHAAKKTGQKLKNILSDIRENLGREFFRMFQQACERKGMNVFSFGQKLRRFREKILQTPGILNAERTAARIGRKKNGRFTVPGCPYMPVTGVRTDQDHNAVNRKLFMMKGFRHPEGSQIFFSADRQSLTILFRISGGRKMLVSDRLPSLRILSSVGFRQAEERFATKAIYENKKNDAS